MQRRTLTQLLSATLAGALLVLWSHTTALAMSPARLKTLNISQTVNGLTVRLRAVRLEGDQVRVNVCYPMPAVSSNEYMLKDVTLAIDGKDVINNGSWLDEWLYADGSRIPAYALKSSVGVAAFTAKGPAQNRCDWLSFDVRRAATLDHAMLVAGGLGMSGIPAGFTCRNVEQVLADQRISIQVRCHEVPPTVMVEVTRPPPTMTREQATAVVQQAVTDYRPGPWQFDLPLK